MPGYLLARFQDEEQMQPLVCVNQTIGNTAAALAAIPDEARGAIIGGDGSTNGIRYRLDGGVPTATLGIRQEGVDTVIIWSRAALLGMQLIREDGTDVVVSVQFFK